MAPSRTFLDLRVGWRKLHVMKYYCDKIKDVMDTAYNMRIEEIIYANKRLVTKSEGNILLEDWG
jgi:hypothetical protein